MSVRVARCVPLLVLVLLLIGPGALPLAAKEQPPVAEAVTAAMWGRILNLSGRQRMLTQRMSKEMLLVALDVDRSVNLARLKETVRLFDKTLRGLRDGDPEAGLPRTAAEPIRLQLRRIADAWKPMLAVVQEVLKSGRVSRAQVGVVAKRNLPLLRECNLCVELFERKAQKLGLKAHPEIATVINLAGRQRMLTQKMCKEYYLLALGHELASNRTRILGSVGLFARTLRGLQHGDEEQGLPAARDLGIKAQLRSVAELWREFMPLMKRAARCEATFPAADLRTVAHKNLPLLEAMDKAVAMFEPVASPNRK